MFDLFFFLARAGAYGLTLWALALAGWPFVRRSFPHATSSLRLAVLLMVLFALNATVVVVLGLAGLLWPVYYIAACALLALAAFFFSGEKDFQATLFRSLRTQLRIRRRPLLVNAAAVLMLLALLSKSVLVDGIDSLSLHGPWIVEMIQAGRLLLQTQFNYPLFWEYQYIPAFMILGSDVLAVVPRALMALLLLLLIHAGARGLRVPSAGANLLAWLCILCPMIWRTDSLKSDPSFAVGMLSTLMAAQRVWKGRRGGLFLALLGGFFLVGSKATGFLYVGLLCVPTLAFHVLRRRQVGWGARLRVAAALVPVTAVVLALPTTIQIANLLRTGSPIHPIVLNIGGYTVFPGSRDLAGTSILEHADDAKTWEAFVVGAIQAVGPELPVLWLVLAIAGVVTGILSLSAIVGRRVGNDKAVPTLFVGCFIVALLWLLFLGTPWTRGNAPGNQGYLVVGQSFRYATGQLFITYILGAGFLNRYLGKRLFGLLSGLVIPVLVVYKWYERKTSLMPLRNHLLPGFAILVSLALIVFMLRRNGLLGMAFENKAGSFPRWATLAGGVAVLLVVFAQHVEVARHAVWMPACREIWTAVRSEVPAGSKIALSASHTNYRYILYGPGLDNVLMSKPGDQSLQRWLEQSKARFLYFKVNKSTRERDLARLVDQGWVSVGQCRDNSAWLLASRTGGSR